MKNSKALLKKAGILPKLRLGKKTDKGVESTGPHRVKMLEDKIKKGVNHEGKEIDVVEYIVEENGEKKRYQTDLKNKSGELHYLVQRLAEIPEGNEVILEMKKRGVKNYVDVIPVGDVYSHEIDEDTKDDEEYPEELVDEVMDSHM